MITQQDIDRINELAHKSKSLEGLTPEELTEQADLRQRYIDSIKSNLTIQLDNTYLMDENGNKKKLKRKD